MQTKNIMAFMLIELSRNQIGGLPYVASPNFHVPCSITERRNDTADGYVNQHHAGSNFSSCGLT